MLSQAWLVSPLALINFFIFLNHIRHEKNEFIANELCLSYRRNDKLTKIFFKDIRNSENLERAFREIWNINEIDIRESFYAIYLNHSLDVVGYYRVGDGGIDSVAIDKN